MFIAIIRIFILRTEEIIERFAPFARVFHFKKLIIIRRDEDETAELGKISFLVVFLQIIEETL